MEKVNLEIYADLIEKNPSHIATVSETGFPNLAVVADVKVIGEDLLLVSHNEMVHTPDNIAFNSNIEMTCFDEKWVGVRIKGIASYHVTGEYFELCNEFFKNETTSPKGAIVVKVYSLEEMA